MRTLRPGELATLSQGPVAGRRMSEPASALRRPDLEAHEPPPSVQPSLGLDGRLPQAEEGPSPTSAPSAGLSAELAWIPRACRLDETQKGQGPGGKVSEGKRAGTPCYQIWRRNGK